MSSEMDEVMAKAGGGGGALEGLAMQIPELGDIMELLSSETTSLGSAVRYCAVWVAPPPRVPSFLLRSL